MSPIYDYLCPFCGERKDIWAKMDEKLKLCEICESIMERLMSPSNIICDIEPYLDPHMASQTKPEPVLVKSRQHKKQLLKERGLVQK
jgi:putative FmdB family regulatory protein